MTESPATGLRARLVEALWEAGAEPLHEQLADVLLPIAEAETARVQAERDQYHAAARHLALRVREAACAWATQGGEVDTDAVYTVLMGIASHVPDRPELRDDLWQRIAGAYEARFENDGHPEDARHAADEAMSVVQPEMDALRAERDRLAAEVAELRQRSARAVELLQQVPYEVLPGGPAHDHLSVRRAIAALDCGGEA